MTDTLDPAQWFGEARALASQRPDKAAWHKLWQLALAGLDTFGESFPDVALPYLDRMASAWPDAERTPPQDWTGWLLTARDWALMPLVRAASLDKQLDTSPRGLPRAQALLSRLDHARKLTLTSAAALTSVIDLTLPPSITHLALSSTGRLPAQLTAAPWLAQLRRLDVDPGWLMRDPHAEPIMPRGLHLPRLEQLTILTSLLLDADPLAMGPVRHLTLERDLSPHALDALLNHPRARHLETLTLVRPNCDRPTLERLVSAADALPALTRLELHNMPLWEQAADGLARHLHLPALRHLTLHTCHISDEELLPMLSHGTLARLDSIDLRGNRLGVDGVALLQEAAPNTQLRLEGNWIEDALSEAPYHLKLSRNRLPPNAFESLGRIIDHQRLERITLRHISLSARDLELVAALRLPALQVLDVRDNGLSAEHAARLIDHDRWPALRALDLSRNYLGDLAALAALLPQRPALSLALASCRITHDGVTSLLGAMQAGWQPRELELSDNPISPAHVVQLGLASPLTALHLKDTVAYALTSLQAHTLTLTPALLSQLTQWDESTVTPIFDAEQWGQVQRLHIIEDTAQRLWPDHLLATLRGPFTRPHRRHTAQLIELSIKGRARLSAEESYRLVNALPPQLQTLRLTDGALTNASAEALTHLLALPDLAVLDLRHSGLTDPAILTHLIQSKLLPKLKLLQLREGNIFDHGILRRAERQLAHVTIV